MPNYASELRVSIIMPVMDETVSLRETVDIVMHENRPEDIHEIICVVSELTKPESLAVCKQLEADLPADCMDSATSKALSGRCSARCVWLGEWDSHHADGVGSGDRSSCGEAAH